MDGSTFAKAVGDAFRGMFIGGIILGASLILLLISLIWLGVYIYHHVSIQIH